MPPAKRLIQFSGLFTLVVFVGVSMPFLAALEPRRPVDNNANLEFSTSDYWHDWMWRVGLCDTQSFSSLVELIKATIRPDTDFGIPTQWLVPLGVCNDKQ